jgi:hypothetical protein
VLLVSSLLLAGGGLAALEPAVHRGEAWAAALLFLLVGAMGAFGLVVAMFRCDSCVARACGDF